VDQKAAVFTGDIIKSSLLEPERRTQLQDALTRAFAGVNALVTGFKVEQYRGDSFQGVLSTHIEKSLEILLFIQAFLHQEDFGVRIALGLGDIRYESQSILTSDGSAFQISGPALDELKKRNQPVAILGPSDSFNAEWRVHALSLGYLIQRWTAPQAEAVVAQLQGLTQEETAQRLQVKQPAVQQRLQATGWTVMSAILERFVTSVHADFL
jgi:hypothetical protein